MFGTHYFLGDPEEATSKECVERLEEGISGRKKWEGSIKKNAEDGCESGDSARTTLRESGSVQGNERVEGRGQLTEARGSVQFMLQVTGPESNTVCPPHLQVQHPPTQAIRDRKYLE